MKGGIVVGVLLVGTCLWGSDFGSAFQLSSALDASYSTPVETSVRSFTIHHMNVNDVKTHVQGLFEGVSCVAEAKQKLLTCRASEERLGRMSESIKALDKPISQIRIEVKIVETSAQQTDFMKHVLSDVGEGIPANIDLNTGTLSVDAPIEALFASLQRRGNAKVLAQPVLTVLNDELSVIKVGDRVPYVTAVVQRDQELQEVRHLDTGVELRLTPTLLSENKVQIDINARVSDIKLWVDLGNTSYPVLSNRQAETLVQLTLNQTLVIAGLLDEQRTTNKSRIPVLWRLPILGHLFTSHQKTQNTSDVIFMITPSLIN